jgi:hypothetical protein
MTANNTLLVKVIHSAIVVPKMALLLGATVTCISLSRRYRNQTRESQLERVIEYRF